LAAEGGVRILLVPWGKNSEAVIREFPPVVQVKRAQLENHTLEDNLNLALVSLLESPPDLVAFLDDDTYLRSNWARAMLQSAEEDKDAGAFASVVFSATSGKLQSQGHAFVNAAPRDRGFNGKGLTCPLLGPCSNSAVVRWSAIAGIRDVHPQVWDPLFNQRQTCFDFGLKLALTGVRSLIVEAAEADHEGYLSTGTEWPYMRAAEEVRLQLSRRYLLYAKFLSGRAYKCAVRALEDRIPRWRRDGYPHFHQVVGDAVDEVHAAAVVEARRLMSSLLTSAWRTLMERRSDQFDLLGLGDPGCCLPTATCK